QNDVTLKMPAFEWVHVQLHQQKGMISLSPPTICNSAGERVPPLPKDGYLLFPELVNDGSIWSWAAGNAFLAMQ
ncbi:hypothetical protein AB8R86_27810, partial [Klebsiella pneumoniae]